MKKIITGACILLVTVMFSPAMAQKGPNERPDRQGDRRIERGNDHWRGQRSTRFANSRGHYGNQKYSRFNNRYRRQMYSRYHNRHKRHLYPGFNSRYQRRMYPQPNHGYYRHRKNW